MLIFFFTFSTSQILAQTIITGKSSSFAGDELKLYTIFDRITYTPELLSTAIVDSEGYFKFEFETNQIIKVYIEMPTIKAFMYIEPNKNYDIRIPKKIELTDEEFLNPYFNKEYVPIYIVTPPENDINALIISYSSYLSKHKENLLTFTNQDNTKAYFDSIQQISDTLLGNIENEYFEYYKKTEFANLRHYFVQYKKRFFIDSFFHSMPILYNSSSYMTLFNQVFDLPFKTGNSLLSLNYVYYGLQKNNFSLIRDSLIQKYPSMSEDFAELIVLKGLYGKFYEIPETQNDIIATLNKASISDLRSENQKIALNILNEITKLRAGEKAPELNLYNQKGKIIELSRYKNEFVYLHFFHPKSFACKQQMPLLENYYSQKIKKLNIITVFVGDNIEQMQNFLLQYKQYKWDFVFASKNNEILKKYDVNVFPKYYLIAPDGSIAVPKTPSPTEDFEKTYNDHYKKWF